MRRIKRALLSVTDKTGLAELAGTLAEFGCELIASGGTAAELRAGGLTVTGIGELSGHDEAFGGRMKTLSFEVASALLFHRERDAAEAEALGIAPIDLVVCNLYPFEEAARAGAPMSDLVEQIDIGGPTMIRAAAKNHSHVAVVTDPGEYGALVEELLANDGGLSPATRTRLAAAAFARTADYEAAIADTLSARTGGNSLRLAFDSARPLRYGENAHQGATWLRQRGCPTSLHDAELLGGKPLSFNNIADLQAAAEAVAGLAGPACVIVKHQNPCGAAAGGERKTLLERAWAGDPVSAFGSVIAFNCPVAAEDVADLKLDGARSERRFVELVCAPAFADDAVALLQRSRNLRIVRFDPTLAVRATDYRFVAGSLLVQDGDSPLRDGLDFRTEARPTAVDEALLDFGIALVRQVKSNAIVVVGRDASGGCRLLGMGAGQPNRVDAVRIAVGRAESTLAADGVERSPGMAQAYLVSDAFFPFPDNIDVCHQAGVRVVFQPGGSLRDDQVVSRCDELGVALAFTGLRHFKH